jgi:hypothetical protein
MSLKNGTIIMNQMPFPEFFEQSPTILGEGAVIERLRRNTGFELDPFIVNSAFIYDKGRRAALETIYRQYLDIMICLSSFPPQPGGPVGNASQPPAMREGMLTATISGFLMH